MRRLALRAAILLSLFAASPVGAAIRYSVSVAHPEQHLFHVRMTIADSGREFVVQLPAWNALYQIRDFAHRVQNVRAFASTGGGQALSLAVDRLDKQTWRIGPRASEDGTLPVSVEYAVYWDELGPFSSQLNKHHAFVNLAEILMYLPVRRAEAVQIDYSDLPSGWKVAEELAASGGANSFVAPSYDALVDAPVEMGAFSEFRFEESGAHFRVVVDGKDWREGQLTDHLRRIVRYEMQLMGGPPFAEYTFFYHFGPSAEVGGGGMEHANCTAIASESGDSATSVSAHEFFHLWNVKRIRPQSLEPLDYSREQYTLALWFAEGVTNTYGAYALERTGLWSRRQWYDDLAAQLQELDSRPARLWKSVEEASLDAWFEKYALYRRPDFSISYYNKGQILGVLLDLKIRDATQNHASLDNVLRAMNEQFAKRGRFYRDSADIQAVAAEVCGCKLDEFFSRYVSGAGEIPYADFLALAGLRLKSSGRMVPDLGILIVHGPENSSIVAAVEPGSSAEAAGILEGDVVLQINRESIPRNITSWLGGHATGEILSLRVRRDGTEREIPFILGGRDVRMYEIEEDSHATKEQRRIRDGLLHGTTD